MRRRIHRLQPTLPGSSPIATSGTDFTASEADFANAHPDCLLLSWEITFVAWELQEVRASWLPGGTAE